MTLRWLIVLTVLAGLGAIIWYALPEAPVTVDAGSKRIEFTLPDLNGLPQSLPKGEVVLLNFWATWCPPCRREIPSMAELHHRFAGSGLKIVAVSVDQRLSDLTSFVKEYQIPFQVLHDGDGATSHSYGVFRYPESFLIDRHGIVRQHLIGAVDWLSPPVTSTIQSMLAEPPITASATAPAGG